MKNRILCIVGGTCTGKSTLFKVILGQMKPKDEIYLKVDYGQNVNERTRRPERRC